MAETPHKILLVEPDPESVELLVGGLSRRFNAQITCVGDGDQCVETDLFEPHDLVIAEIQLPDMNGVELAEQLMTLRTRPIILLATEPALDETLEALRLGVTDMLRKPFGLTELLDAAERAIRGYQLRRQHAAKYHRMRELVRHVIRERRALNRRVELVCRDLVGAQRQLVDRVLSFDKAKPHGEG